MAKKIAGVIEKRGTTWRLRMYDRRTGKQRCWSGFSTQKKAEDKREKEYHAMALQAKAMKDAKLTAEQKVEFTELLERFKKKGAAALTMKFSELLERFTKQKVSTFSEGAQRAYEQSFAVFREYWIEPLDEVPKERRDGLPSIRDPLIHEIDSDDVAKFLSWRRAHPFRGKTLSEWTVKKDRGVLHGMFQFAIKPCRLLKMNPVADTEDAKIEKREPVPLSDDDFAKLLEKCDDDMLRLYVLALGETGARCESEALWLRWDHLDFKNNCITIKSDRKMHRTKTGRSRIIPMSPALRTALEAHMQNYRLAMYNGERSPWVFHYTETRGKQHVAGARIRSLRYQFKEAAKRAKLSPELRQHDCRHARATAWAKKNVVLAQKALGHASLQMTQHYVHVTAEDTQALVN